MEETITHTPNFYIVYFIILFSISYPISLAIYGGIILYEQKFLKRKDGDYNTIMEIIRYFIIISAIIATIEYFPTLENYCAHEDIIQTR